MTTTYHRRFPIATLRPIKSVRAVWVGLMLALVTPPCCADGFTLSTALEDTKEYVTSPLRWDAGDWLFLGGTIAAVGTAHAFDARVRTHFATGSYAKLDGADRNSLRDFAPTLALLGGTWAYAGWLGDRDGYRETWALIEAGVFSAASAEVFGLATGRQRPDATTSPNRWFSGSDSFPSLHVSTAFAVGTTFAESGNDDYRWLRRIIGYGFAAGTGYVRMHENVHWLSDTVAGAALGIATARFVLHRHNTNQDADQTASLSSVSFGPVKDGWQLQYSVRMR